MSNLTCCDCRKDKKVDEKMYILSLPIPEAEFNYYSVIVVPVMKHVIKKVVFKLHRSATVVSLKLVRATISMLLKKRQGKTPKITSSAKPRTIPSRK